MTTNSIILNVDSYKSSHYLQYPKGIETVSSYIESRGGEYEDSVFFGLQIFLKKYLSQPITQLQIDEAQEVFQAHGVPFNQAGWQYILDEHNGFLPLEIQAVEEGTVLPLKNVLVQVANTDEKCAWLTSYIETALLRAVWYPMTVATLSRHCKKKIARYLLETSGSLDGLEFKLHDFGARGVSSEESAAIGGLAHLVNFMGTDTLSAVLAAKRYYGETMAGFSIPAAEHSTITSWGREHELDAYQNMLDQFSGEDKLVAVVSDSYDLWNAVDNLWGEALKEKIIKSGGTLVVRPDSGDPVSIVCETIKRLMKVFGYSENKQGYHVLPSCIRVIQGDGISSHSIQHILEAMKKEKLSVENIAFGMGGELLQKINRDTMKFAMKASAAKVNGEWRDVYKDPVTDSGKRSKRGRLALVKSDSNYQTIRESDLKGQQNYLVPVFSNGKILRECTFSEVRERAQLDLGSQ